MTTGEIIVLAVFIMTVFSVYFAETVLIGMYAYRMLRRRYSRILLYKRAMALHVLALVGIAFFCYGYFVEPYRIQVKEIRIQTSKLVHASFRIVQLSDLHCDKRPANEKEIVRITNDLKPDIIVFTGDAINSPSYLPVFKETMKSLNASLGKFAVYGNWETRHWPGLDYYSQTGFQLLDVNTVQVEKSGEKITISGLCCDNPQADWRTMHTLSEDTYNVFLFHYSDLAGSVRNFKVDLYLCGHTHGGQIALPFYGALITMCKTGKKYEAGEYSIGKTILYVNRGLGMDRYPPRIRLFARPEITVFDIQPK